MATRKIILASIIAFGMTPATSEAIYEAKSDTGTEIFDHIENQRREIRENLWSEDQKQLQQDIEEAKARLPKAIEDGEPIPAAFEGDDLVFNAITGEFRAKGKVDIIQLEGYRFQSTEARGNVNTQDIHVKSKAHMIQINENSPRVTLDGYNTVYNYGNKTGTMERVKGKVGHYYIGGKRFEFYPDHIVAYDAYQTKCGAQDPDYRVSAKRMEIYPDQIIRMYDVKFLISDMVVGKKKYLERKLDDNNQPYFPRVGYNKSHGFYIEDRFAFPVINDHFQAVLNAHYETKNGIRSSGELHYDNREFATKVLYGFYYDSDGRWLKKSPSLDLAYSRGIHGLPLTYGVEYEVGKWSSGNTASTHQDIVFGLNHDPISLWDTYILSLGVGYKITKDDVDYSDLELTVRGWSYGAKLYREFNERFAAFTAYEYNKNTSQNSLYDFDTDSYSHKFSTGVSYRLTDKDRFVAGLKFDTKGGTLEDVDYYWYHDLHCSTAILRWREKRDEVQAQWQFTPW